MDKYCILIPTNHITQTVQEEDRSFFFFFFCYFFCHIQFINILNESAKLPTQWMSIHHSLLGIGNMTIGYVCTVVILHNILCCVWVIRGILLPQWALPYVPIILPSANHSSKTTSFAPFIHWVHRRPTTLSISESPHSSRQTCVSSFTSSSPSFSSSLGITNVPSLSFCWARILVFLYLGFGTGTLDWTFHYGYVNLFLVSVFLIYRVKDPSSPTQ